jgi:glycosyltransferase involved in cell wall biosynthesis
MKIALAMICKGQDGSEKEHLLKCLSDLEMYFDGVFLTITTKNGKADKGIVKIAKQFNCNISYFEWVNDFSKARNFNFSQVPKEYDYISWVDTDDTIKGVKKLRKLIEDNLADIYSMFYIYSTDERGNPDVVHKKSQIVKNDGCVKWAGRLHEDFAPTREVKIYHISDIKRVHLAKHEDYEEAKQRNYQIAKEEAKDMPEDPRSWWNLGNSQKALGDMGAIESFNKFLEMSKSDDEKYIVRLRLSECYWFQKKYNEAIDEGRYAIGIKPDYPDAYNLLGSLYLESDQNDKAIEMYKMSLSKKPPYYEILVYNPRDYDYVPLMNLAKAYFKQNLPTLALECLKACQKIVKDDTGLNDMVKMMEGEAKKFDQIVSELQKLNAFEDKDKLKEYMDSLPLEVKSHPAVCKMRNINFVKDKSSGKDLVYFCGFTSEEWDGDTARTKGLGGSEEAVVNLSEGLAKLGWNVEVYNNCGSVEKEINGVKYKPFWSWNYRDKQDACILWRTPKMAEYEINSDKVYLDVHDVIGVGEFTEERMKNIDKVFFKSKFHADFYNVPKEKTVIVPNGIWFDQFEPLKKEKILINTSSPDRSLEAVVDCWKEIRKKCPDYKMYWMYGWKVYDYVHKENPEMMAWKDKMVKGMAEAGIIDLGRVSHEEVKDYYRKAIALFYPSEFAEIDCISMSKAIASDCVPITTDFAAMGEKNVGIIIHSEKTKDDWCLPYQIHFGITDEKQKKEFVDKTVAYLKGDKIKTRDKASKYDWPTIINNWNEILCQKKIKN